MVSFRANFEINISDNLVERFSRNEKAVKAAKITIVVLAKIAFIGALVAAAYFGTVIVAHGILAVLIDDTLLKGYLQVICGAMLWTAALSLNHPKQDAALCNEYQTLEDPMHSFTGKNLVDVKNYLGVCKKIAGEALKVGVEVGFVCGNIFFVCAVAKKFFRL